MYCPFQTYLNGAIALHMDGNRQSFSYDQDDCPPQPVLNTLKHSCRLIVNGYQLQLRHITRANYTGK